MMNKSTTNRDSAEEPGEPIVCRTHIGHRVLVNGHFGGVLRFLGAVAGKRGLFCGVELDQPVGKNDGTHEGVSYFECRTNHGVFAPAHKVQLEYSAVIKKVDTTAKFDNRLTCSAIPGLSSSSSSSAPSVPAPPPPAMDWSLMSTGSTNSGCSAAAGPFNIFDDSLMAHSQATYTVFESECLMLSDLELTDSALLRLEEDEESDGNGWTEEEEEGRRGNRPNGGILLALDRSVVLDGPTLLDRPLPVIGTTTTAGGRGKEEEGEEEGETPTPMVETKTMVGTELDRRNRNHLALELNLDGKRARKEGGDPSPNNNSAGVLRSEGGGSTVISPNNNNRQQKGPGLTKGGEGRETKGREGREEPTKGAKKLRTSVFQSVPPPMPNPAVAAARAKPKQPSKSQLITEQLKASIWAEKQRPKKEIRAKVTTEKGEEREGGESREREQSGWRKDGAGGGAKISPAMKSQVAKKVAEERNHIGDINKLSKTTATASSSVVSPAISNRNSTTRAPLSRSKFAQKSTSAPDQTCNSKIGSKATSSSSVNKARSAAVHASRSVLSSRENTDALKMKMPLCSLPHQPKKGSVEQVAHPPPKPRTTLKGDTPKVSAHTKNTAEKYEKVIEKRNSELERARQMLRDNGRTMDVFMVLSAHLVEKLTSSDSEIAKLHVHLEQQSAEHVRSREEVESIWQRRVQCTREETQKEIANIREKMEAEHAEKVRRINQLNQQTVSELLDQGQKLKDRQEEQEWRHRVELADSENETINRLNRELESRKYELQMKAEELVKLRQANRELQFEADKLTEKEVQVGKLEARNDDLRAEVNRLRQLEKKLLAQIEEYRHELGESRTKAEAVTREKEMLEYQLNEQQHTGNGVQIPPTPKTNVSTAPAPGTPTPISMRTPDSQRKYLDRPSSSCLSHRKTSISHRNDAGDMSRSMDSAMSQSVISYYMQEGRSKSQNTPTKIYTPRDVYEVPDPTVSNAKRTVNFDSTDEVSMISDDGQSMQR